MTDWLPELILLEQHEGNWDNYLAAIYALFRQDFCSGAFQFRGKRVGLKRHPVIKNKEATFWHMISEGSKEDDRIPDIRRCERIGWPRAILNNCDHDDVKSWSENRGGKASINLWCEQAEYLVVLADRGEYVLPWTAYTVVRNHSKQKLNARWEKFGQNG